jgi:hypothetical protein
MAAKPKPQSMTCPSALQAAFREILECRREEGEIGIHQAMNSSYQPIKQVRW